MKRIQPGSSGRARICLAGICAVLLAAVGLASTSPAVGRWASRREVPPRMRAVARDLAGVAAGHTSVHRISHAFDCRGKPGSPLRAGFLPARFEGAGRSTMVSAAIGAPPAIAVPDLDVRFLLPPGVGLVNGLLKNHASLAPGETLIVSVTLRVTAPGEQWIGVLASSRSLGWAAQGSMSLTGPRGLTLMAEPSRDPFAAAIAGRAHALAVPLLDPAAVASP